MTQLQLSRRKLIVGAGLLIAAPAPGFTSAKATEKQKDEYLFSSHHNFDGTIVYSAYNRATGLYTQFYVGGMYSGRTAREIFRKRFEHSSDWTAA